jgi:hypothetical protein
MTFREYCIECIISSKLWQDCVNNGMEEELPNLNNLSHADLLGWIEHIIGRC